jgi:hypothetical protein
LYKLEGKDGGVVAPEALGPVKALIFGLEK